MYYLYNDQLNILALAICFCLLHNLLWPETNSFACLTSLLVSESRWFETLIPALCPSAVQSPGAGTEQWDEECW